MKKIIIVIICILFLTACGSSKVIDNKKYDTIGLVNIIVNDKSTMEVKAPNIKYKIIWGNVIWGALLFGTVIAPIYFYGFSMFEPVESLNKERRKG